MAPLRRQSGLTAAEKRVFRCLPGRHNFTDWGYRQDDWSPRQVSVRLARRGGD
jgi:hypothetical protein